MDAGATSGSKAAPEAAASPTGPNHEPAAPQPPAPSLPPPRRPWARIFVTGTALGLALATLVPVFRSWAYGALVLPVVADVLGRDMLSVYGYTVSAAYTRGVQVGIVAVFIVLLLALRAALLERRARGSLWAGRVRIDGALMLALVPFMALGPVMAALESGLLFNVPWAFVAVPPLLVLFMMATAVVSLLFGLWVEDGGQAHARGRYVSALLVFVSFDLFWVSVLGGTTERLVWWAAPLALVLSFLVYYGVTLGNRMLSHRRVLFALGFFHTAFFGTFLAQWMVQGPWPGHDWSYASVHATRVWVMTSPWNGMLSVLPPVGVATGLYTVGAFLHRYHVFARPFTNGLNMALVFAHLLDGWVTTLLLGGAFESLAFPPQQTGPVSSWAAGLLGGYGYFVLKGVLAVVAVIVLDWHMRRAGGSAQRRELNHLARGGLVALGLVPGLRIAIRLTTGL